MEKKDGSSSFLKKVFMAINIFVYKYPWECNKCGRKGIVTKSIFKVDYDIECMIQGDHKKTSPKCKGKASLV